MSTLRRFGSHNYQIDSENFKITSGSEEITLQKSSDEICRVANATLSWIYKIYFFLLDFFSNFGLFKERRFEILKENITFLDAIKWRKESEEFIHENYDRIIRNVPHLDQAEIICLGETHWNEAHMKRNAQIIDALAKPGDLILVEHDEKGEHFGDEQIKYVKAEVPSYGWDSDKLRSKDSLGNSVETIAASTGLIMLLLIAELSKSLTTAGLGAILSYLYKKRLDSREIQIIDENLPARNEHMCQVIEKNRKAGRRIFVVAGSAHFRPPTELEAPIYKNQQKMFDLTIDYFKDKPTIMLG